jgi:hypothetical protein
MNLSEKESIAVSTVKKEDEKKVTEEKAIQEVEQQITIKKEMNTTIKEDIKA